MCALQRVCFSGEAGVQAGRRGVLTSKNPSAKPPPITPRRFFGTEFAKATQSALLARRQNDSKQVYEQTEFSFVSSHRQDGAWLLGA